MDRAAVVHELEAAMLTGSEAQQDAARGLLSEVGGAEAFQRLRARTGAVSQYMDVLEGAENRIRELFEASIVEARHGFRIATAMDIVIFAIGVSFIIASGVVALVSGGGLEQWVGIGVAGTAGVLGVLYGVLIANPRRQVTETVDHLMYLKVVFLAYLRQLHQTDLAYTRRVLEDEAFTATELAAFTRSVETSMASALSKLGTRLAGGPSIAEAGAHSAGGGEAAVSSAVGEASGG
jgi:hypothetical protein